jgi:hypothetical protein
MRVRTARAWRGRSEAERGGVMVFGWLDLWGVMQVIDEL